MTSRFGRSELVFEVLYDMVSTKTNISGKLQLRSLCCGFVLILDNRHPPQFQNNNRNFLSLIRLTVLLGVILECRDCSFPPSGFIFVARGAGGTLSVFQQCQWCLLINTMFWDILSILIAKSSFKSRMVYSQSFLYLPLFRVVSVDLLEIFYILGWYPTSHEIT